MIKDIKDEPVEITTARTRAQRTELFVELRSTVLDTGILMVAYAIGNAIDRSRYVSWRGILSVAAFYLVAVGLWRWKSHVNKYAISRDWDRVHALIVAEREAENRRAANAALESVAEREAENWRAANVALESKKSGL